MNRVLVLNATFQPMNIVSVKRAVNLVLARKATALEVTERVLRSPSVTVPEPAVIQLLRYVYVPWNGGAPLSRRAVLARDHHTCQYCGQCYPTTLLTLDHVVPRSQGGLSVWENLVAACGACNRRKRNRTPAQAHMRLLSQPYRPRVQLTALLEPGLPAVWDKYLG